MTKNIPVLFFKTDLDGQTESGAYTQKYLRIQILRSFERAK